LTPQNTRSGEFLVPGPSGGVWSAAWRRQSQDHREIALQLDAQAVGRRHPLAADQQPPWARARKGANRRQVVAPTIVTGMTPSRRVAREEAAAAAEQEGGAVRPVQRPSSSPPILKPASACRALAASQSGCSTMRKSGTWTSSHCERSFARATRRPVRNQTSGFCKVVALLLG